MAIIILFRNLILAYLSLFVLGIIAVILLIVFEKL